MVYPSTLCVEILFSTAISGPDSENGHILGLLLFAGGLTVELPIAGSVAGDRFVFQLLTQPSALPVPV